MATQMDRHPWRDTAKQIGEEQGHARGANQEVFLQLEEALSPGA